MANAMLQAIGAQAAFPDRQVISMSGDGGFTMMMGDFLTLVQAQLPVKIVVLNNGTLGFVELEMKANGFLPNAICRPCGSSPISSQTRSIMTWSPSGNGKVGFASWTM